MTHRKYLMLSAGVVLVLLNVWRWWPSSENTSSRSVSTSHSREFRLDQFDIKMMPSVATAESRRDIFRPRQVVLAPVRKASHAPPEPPPKTPEEMEIEMAHAELGQIKCVGVVFRAGKGQAFILRGDQTFLVFVGDKVGERFVVEQITSETVLLKDPNTSVSGEILVSGK